VNVTPICEANKLNVLIVTTVYVNVTSVSEVMMSLNILSGIVVYLNVTSVTEAIKLNISSMAIV
jgi:hypothetical protein